MSTAVHSKQKVRSQFGCWDWLLMRLPFSQKRMLNFFTTHPDGGQQKDSPSASICFIQTRWSLPQIFSRFDARNLCKHTWHTLAMDLALSRPPGRKTAAPALSAKTAPRAHSSKDVAAPSFSKPLARRQTPPNARTTLGCWGEKLSRKCAAKLKTLRRKFCPHTKQQTGSNACLLRSKA